MTQSPLKKIDDALHRISLRAHNQMFRQVNDGLGDEDRMKMIQADCSVIAFELKNLEEKPIDLVGKEKTDENSTTATPD